MRLEEADEGPLQRAVHLSFKDAWRPPSEQFARRIAAVTFKMRELVVAANEVGTGVVDHAPQMSLQLRDGSRAALKGAERCDPRRGQQPKLRRGRTERALSA